LRAVAGSEQVVTVVERNETTKETMLRCAMITDYGKESANGFACILGRVVLGSPLIIPRNGWTLLLVSVGQGAVTGISAGHLLLQPPPTACTEPDAQADATRRE